MLRFTDKALEDLERLHEFVADKNPLAADRIRTALLASLQTLLKQPLGGNRLTRCLFASGSRVTTLSGI
ncbi:type II toxin-antitoxin system RelE/ParE family toxin [Granulosicoccus sp.]|nr:type II toxin-antitoxin system RelE/ParE family toxin [Granulosicoccus sp.]